MSQDYALMGLSMPQISLASPLGNSRSARLVRYLRHRGTWVENAWIVYRVNAEKYGYDFIIGAIVNTRGSLDNIHYFLAHMPLKWD